MWRKPIAVLPCFSNELYHFSPFLFSTRHSFGTTQWQFCLLSRWRTDVGIKKISHRTRNHSKRSRCDLSTGKLVTTIDFLILISNLIRLSIYRLIRKWIILNSYKRFYRRWITTEYSSQNQTHRVCTSPKIMDPMAVQSSTKNPNSNWSIMIREFWKFGASKATRWPLRLICVSLKRAKRFVCAQRIWRLVMVHSWLNYATNRERYVRVVVFLAFMLHSLTQISLFFSREFKDLLKFNQQAADGRPLLIFGDFNAEPTEPVYSTMINCEALGLSSAYADLMASLAETEDKSDANGSDSIDGKSGEAGEEKSRANSPSRTNHHSRHGKYLNGAKGVIPLTMSSIHKINLR